MAARAKIERRRVGAQVRWAGYDYKKLYCRRKEEVHEIQLEQGGRGGGGGVFFFFNDTATTEI